LLAAVQLWARICPAELENKIFFPFYSVRERERERERERGHLEHIPQRRLTTPRTKTLLRVDYSLSFHSPSYQTVVPFSAAHASCPYATTSRRIKRLADPQTDLDCKQKQSPETKKKTPHHPPTISQSPGESKYSSGALISLSLMHCR
jgi:hypothetical protein